MTAKQEVLDLMSDMSEEEAIEVLGLLKKLMKSEKKKGVKRKFGVYKGKFWMADDFDETPDCFKDYI